MPRVALDAFKALQDPIRREAFIGQLTTRSALTQLTWECHELQDQLLAAAEGNQHLTDEQRRLLEKRFETLHRSLVQLREKLEVAEGYQTALDGLMQEYARVQQTATTYGVQAPTRHLPPMMFDTQTPAGWGR